MYIRRIGHVLSAHNSDTHGSCTKTPDNQYCRVEKIGRVLTLKEENAIAKMDESLWENNFAGQPPYFQGEIIRIERLDMTVLNG